VDAQSPGCKLTLAHVAAWLASSALLVVDALLVRGAVLDILGWIGARGKQTPSGYSNFGWTIEFVDRALLLTLACVGVGLSVVLEYYYRWGAGQGRLARRVRRGMGALLAVGLAALVLQLAF
jgi:hypothetical protein